MATRVSLVDDFDENVDADERILFAFDGRAYCIDLSEVHAKELRDMLEPYQDAGKDLGRYDIKARNLDDGYLPSRRTRPTRDPDQVLDRWFQAERDDTYEVATLKKNYRMQARAWVKKHHPDVKVNERGALPDKWYIAYHDWRVQQGLPTGPASVQL